MANTPTAPSIQSLEEEFLGKIDGELAELEPQVARYNDLSDLRKRVTGTGSKTRSGTASRSTSGSAQAKPGSRQQQFEQLVKDKPGITISEAANEMGVATNYLYRLRDKGQAKNTIRVEGSKLYTVEPGEGEPTEPSAARVAELEAAGAAK